MGLFSKKKQKVDYDAMFKEQYKSVNQLLQQANNEMDYIIKESILTLVVEKYNELIELIDQGADFDKNHFIALKNDAKKQLEDIQAINKGL
ncbi:MAG: hypothetical protein LUF02_11175 [Erysipelotrichaceae bacterium]|nr:hypothetical protein [Erysipelotrichaceae bacterium]